MNRQFQPKLHLVASEWVLHEIITKCNSLQSSPSFLLYLFPFFSFLKISNFLLHSIPAFDVNRQFCVGDVIFGYEYTLVIIKWSKYMQNRAKNATISSLRCFRSLFHQSLENRLTSVRQKPHCPLFQVMRSSRSRPLTDSLARKHLSHISHVLLLASVDR